MTPARSRLALTGLFVGVCLTLSAFPVSNYLKGSGNKDYPLWYATGLMVRCGFDLYPADPAKPFDFLYPTFPAVVLAGLSHLGPGWMVVALVAGNAASWLACVWLADRLAAWPGSVPAWARVVPSAVCLFFISDMFLLGQPNLFLLALVLGGLACLQARRPWAAAGLFAVATAVKAFPGAVVVYLLWRRYWTAAVVTFLFTIALLVLVPAPVRGFDRNLHDLGLWVDGMVLRGGSGGVGQRPERSIGWPNQSLMGVGQRLLRPANSEAAAGPDTPPVYVNVVDLGYRGALAGVAVAAALLGLAFVAAMPRRADRTRSSDADEFGMLVVLMTVASPYAFGYFFVWLLFPLAVLTRHAATDPDRAGRQASCAVIAGAVVLLAAGAPLGSRHLGPAAGADLWAALLILAGLGWHLWRAGRSCTVAEGLPAPAGRVPDAAGVSG